jgi:hypothetical protein
MSAPVVAGVLLLLCCSSSSSAMLMMGGGDDKKTALGPSGPSGPSGKKSLKSRETLKNVTDKLTLDGVKFDDPTVLSGIKKAVLIADVAIDRNSEGIIYESGGTGHGTVLYVTNGKLYCQTGKGNIIGGTVEVSWNIPNTTSKTKKTEIGVSLDVSSSPSRAKLFIDGTEVDNKTTDQVTGMTLSGGNKGGSGKKYDSVSVTNLGETEVYTDTIYTVEVYPGIYI